MAKYALFGHPLGHSMSPLIHEKLFALSGKTDCTYELADVDRETLIESPELLSSFSGMNVTIPYKQEVISLIDELGESALRYNSVNCIDNKDGRLIGYNTDCDGFVLSAGKRPLGGNVAILGCGGVGRMIAIEVARHGGDITLAVIPQDMDNAQKLTGEILEKCPGTSVRIVEISALSGSFDLLINATPVGMYPKVNACAVSDEVIENSGSVFDVIYNPTETLLMKKARALGKTAVGGAAMLVYQAVKAHEIWYGGKFSDNDIAAIIKDVEAHVDSMNKA